MNRTVIGCAAAALGVVFGLGCGCGSPDVSGGLSAFPPAREVEARLFRVERGIDAPERGTPGAAEATAALRAMVDGRWVRIEFTDTRRRDRFGRLLASVWVVADDGREINPEAELLAAGLVRRWE